MSRGISFKKYLVKKKVTNLEKLYMGQRASMYTHPRSLPKSSEDEDQEENGLIR
jgi:hypothetical protein